VNLILKLYMEEKKLPFSLSTFSPGNQTDLPAANCNPFMQVVHKTNMYP